MSVQKIEFPLFLQLATTYPVLDVRSPGEYQHAHIPEAYSFPLFSDEERVTVGTLYKQENREKAIKKGLEYFGPKMVAMIEEAEKIVQAHKQKVAGKNAVVAQDDKTILVHCWRGGMRSAGVAWLLDLYGFQVYTPGGGYKIFRTWVLEQFSKHYPLVILGGYTGSGKTEILHLLQQKGESVIDLESIAQHKGSSFGNLDHHQLPSQEMFENRLAMALSQLSSQTKPPQRIWMEDESRRIGNINIPTILFQNMRQQPVVFLNIDFEERLNYLVQEYGKATTETLINAIIRIKKRLGGLDTKNAIQHLLDNNVKECFRILLKYYDKQYEHGLHDRENLASLLHTIDIDSVDAKNNTEKLVLTLESLNLKF